MDSLSCFCRLLQRLHRPGPPLLSGHDHSTSSPLQPPIFSYPDVLIAALIPSESPLLPEVGLSESSCSCSSSNSLQGRRLGEHHQHHFSSKLSKIVVLIFGTAITDLIQKSQTYCVISEQAVTYLYKTKHPPRQPRVPLSPGPGS